MKNSLCLLTSDVHGNIIQYNKLKQIVIAKKISYVFLCGDNLPKTGGLWSPENKIRTIEMQKKFITEFFIPYLHDLSKYTYIYAISGNDDFKSNYHLFQTLNHPKITFLKTAVVPLGDNDSLSVAGYPYVSLTPFLQKDWEKLEDNFSIPDNKGCRVDGYTSHEGKHLPITFDINNNIYGTITEDLNQLIQRSDPVKTLYLFHDAPYNTPLDMTFKENPNIKNGEIHIGSRAIRKFIEDHNPMLTMHGHIHETCDISGKYIWKNNKSISLAAGNNFQSDKLAYVLFSIPSLKNIERFVE